MKIKSYIIIFVFLASVIVFINSELFAGHIYHEKEEIVYIGGYSFNLIQLNVDRKRNLYLKNKTYALSSKKGDDEIQLFYKTKETIRSYDIINNEVVAIGVGDLSKKESKYYSSLNIVDMEGENKKNLNNCIVLSRGKYFSTSKDGNKIAYITGEAVIEGRNPFKSQGVWVYDIKKDNLKKISEKGVHLNWSRHDNNIYIEDVFDDPSTISMFNTSIGKITRSDKKGIVFSDDGKYYIARELINDVYPVNKFILYDNHVNKPIYVFTGNEGFGLSQALSYKFIVNTHYLLVIDLWGYKVFDVDSKKLIKKSNKRVVGWNKDMTKVVVYEGGGKEVHIHNLISGSRIMSVKIPQP